MTGSPTHSKARRLAGAVLAAAIDKDWPKATRYFHRLNTECDSSGLAEALIGWCDTVLDHCYDGNPPKTTEAKITTVDPTTGTAHEQLPPRVQWANRLITARLTMDEDEFNSALGQVNSIRDGYERGRWASALIETAALTIRKLPRGYMRLGEVADAPAG
jgi:hypothetical protein